MTVQLHAAPAHVAVADASGMLLLQGSESVGGQLCDYRRPSHIGQQFGGALRCLAGLAAAHRQKPLPQSCRCLLLKVIKAAAVS